MTHILLPIKDITIESLRKEFEAIPKGITPDDIINNLVKRERILGKMELLTKGKVISLDPVDINEKAKSYVFNEWGEEDWQKEQCYKQALKDLL